MGLRTVLAGIVAFVVGLPAIVLLGVAIGMLLGVLVLGAGLLLLA